MDKFFETDTNTAEPSEPDEPDEGLQWETQLLLYFFSPLFFTFYDQGNKCLTLVERALGCLGVGGGGEAFQQQVAGYLSWPELHSLKHLAFDPLLSVLWQQHLWVDCHQVQRVLHGKIWDQCCTSVEEIKVFVAILILSSFFFFPLYVYSVFKIRTFIRYIRTSINHTTFSRPIHSSTYSRER
jgi:hypothetical protein